MKHLERVRVDIREAEDRSEPGGLTCMAGVFKAVEAYTGEGFTTVSIRNFNVVSIQSP